MTLNSSPVKTMESVNPCCSKWVKAYKKLEGKRNALRNGVEILQKQIDLLQQDNASLKKACDEERARVNVVEKEKGEEASLRISMEKEIAALKSETSSIGPQATSGNVELDNEATHLRTCISEKEMEIDRLKQLLADEITRVNVEKNAVELERKNVAELQKSLEYEKGKAEEASKISDAAARKAEDHRIQLETLRNELEKTNLKWVEVNRKLEAEKQDAIKEKRCSDEKRVQEEECRANYFTQLEEEKQKVEKLQNELQEIMTLKSSVDTSELDEVKRKLEAEKNKVAKEKRRVAEEKVKVSEQRKIAEVCEKRVSEEKCRADELMRQFEEEKQKVENLQRELQEVLSSQKAIDSSQFDELKKNLEEERKKVVEEQKCVEEEKARVMEQRKIADANKQRGSEEKLRADNLFIQLEEEKQKVEKLQRELQEALSSRITIDSSDFHELKRNLEEEKKKVAQEQRCVEEEKVRTMEQKKIADANKKRFSEEKGHNDKLLMELEEEKRKVEELQRELQEGLPSQKAIDSSVFDELKRNLEEEKKKVAQGQRCVEEEKVRTIEQKKIADANKKVASEEKSRADKLLVLLEEEKRKVDKLQRELQEVVSSKKLAKSSELDEVNRNLEAEKKKVVRERKRGDLETSRKEEQKNLAEASIKNAMEEKSRADKLFEELVSSREMIKNLERELNKVNGMLKAERIEVGREKTRADLQKLKSEEQGQIAVTNEMRAMEEKSRGDNLFQELVNARKQLQDVEHELNEVKLCRGLNRTSVVAPFAVNEQAARVTLLQEQLKFEKKRVKHAKEVAKLEKDRNSILQQELKRLKQDFQCLLDHLGMLSDTFGTRNGVANILKKSGLPQMRYHGDDELRMSSLSSKDASCRFKPNMRLVQAGLCMESTSGMENELDPLQGGSRGDTIPTSALNSNTASFSDEQLLGSQERVAGSLNMSAGLSVENPKQRATILRDSNECYKGKTGEKVCIAGDHSIRSPVEAVTDHAKKRRKILDEIESIKHMHLEGKSIFQEAEKKLFTLQNTLLQPLMNDQLEKENFPLPVNKKNLCGDSDWSSKKRKILREPDLVFRQANDPNVEMEVDKTFAPSATETREISQPSTDLEIDRVEHIQDTLTDFDQVINGDYMKLLDLDDAVAEECFKMAMERPLSPIPPELLEFGQKARALTLSEPISGDNEAEHQAYTENQLYFVLFTDLEDISSITRIYGASRACLARCLFFQTDFSLQDILMALLLEKDLRPREKARVLFSLILLNFSAVSSSKPVNFGIQELMDSFSANIHSVLFNSETRDLFAKICDLRELLTLSEDFVLNRKIMSNFMTSELLGGCSSCVEILLDGKKIVLWPKMASTDLVVAGSIVFASISKAVGHTGYVCEVSLKILQIDRAEYSLALKVLHSFVHVCGEEYFSISNYSSVMNVVRSVATFMEGTIAKNAVQPGDSSQNQFTPCVRCPFSEGSVSVDVVSSELLEELQSHIVPQDPVVSAHPSNREALNCLLGDILSSLELISSIMGWDWVCDKIVPKLFMMLESSHQDRVFTTALVVLLGDIGRLGVKARGYDDIGIEGIKRHLLGLLYQTAASKCDTTLPMAIVYGLIGLYPKGLEMFQKGNNFVLPAEGSHSASSSSDIVSKFLSSLSSEQITSLVSLVNPDNRCS